MIHIFVLQRNVFTELARGDQILGVNFPLNSITNYASFEMERIFMGEKVLEKNYAPVAQEFLKKGCPRCLRAKIWALILGSEVKQPVIILSIFSGKLNNYKTSY